MDIKIIWIVVLGVFLSLILISLVVVLFILLKEKKIKNQTITKLDNELNEIKKKKVDEYIEYCSINDKLKIDKYFQTYYEEKENKKLEELKENKEAKLMQIIESLTFYNEWRNKVTTTIVPDNIDIIPRLIGKDGVNKRYIENELNILMVIEKPASKGIVISSHSPYRKELARRVIEKLLSSSTIDKNRIERYKIEITNQLNNEITDIGKQAFKTLGVNRNYNEKIFYYIGMLQYRTSFFQNILSHSLEVATLASEIAKLIGVNYEQAKLCAFFHDIGKSIDLISSNGLDHVEQGILIAKECGLEDSIIHSIESHHSKVVTQDIYASITILADKISGSMPNARINSDHLIAERCSKIERICNEINGVKKTYAIKSGNELRVILEKYNGSIQERFEIVAEEIKEKLNSQYPEYSSIDVVICANFEFKTKIAQSNQELF